MIAKIFDVIIFSVNLTSIYHALVFMPHFDVITLFPAMFAALTEYGVVGRAFKNGKASLRCWNPREFAQDIHKAVDDRPYGGGPGMVMMAQPLANCLRAIRATHHQSEPVRPVIFLTPHGPLLKQADVRQWVAQETGAILLCGRYEGVDQRFIVHMLILLIV